MGFIPHVALKYMTTITKDGRINEIIFLWGSHILKVLKFIIKWLSKRIICVCVHRLVCVWEGEGEREGMWEYKESNE